MFLTLSIFNTIYNDVAQPWQIGFQDSAAPGFTGIIELHNTIFFYLIVICVGVFWVLGSTMYYFNIKNSPIIHKYLNHGKFVPIQKCSKLNNNIFKNGIFISKYTYSTVSNNPLKNDNINYVKLYENASDMKKDILNENKGKSGIYMFTNKITKKIYIGQSSDLSNRFKNYFNSSYIKSKSSIIIHKALIKYGYPNFSLTILEYCNKSDLLTREKFYFEKLNPQYNILKIAGSSKKSKASENTKAKTIKSLKRVYIKEKSSLFDSLHTEGTKNLMSLKKLKENNPLFGNTNSENSKELMKKKALGRKHSEDTKLKMSAINGNPVNIYEKLCSKGFKLIGSFISARKAGKFLGISGSTIIKYKNSGEIFKDRYKFSSK
jgi:group I intron endonuclease